MKEKKLYDAWKELTEAGLAIFDNTLKTGGSIPQLPYTAVHFKKDSSGFSTKEESVPSLSLFVEQQEEAIQKLPEYKDYEDIVKAIFKNGTSKGVLKLRIWFIVRSFFAQHLRQNNSEMNFNKSVFDNLYMQFENYLLADTVPYRVSVTLDNFVFNNRGIILDEKCRIRRYQKSDIEKLIQPSPFSTTPLLGIGPHSFLVELDYELPWKKDSVLTSPNHHVRKQINQDIKKVLLALRLLGPGRLMKRFVTKGSLVPWSMGFSKSLGFNPEASNRNFPAGGPDLRVKDQDVGTLCDLWDLIKGFSFSQLDNQFNLAIDRFNSSYKRTIEGDKLLDFCLALEALYSSRGEWIGRRERARRAAILLGNHDGEKMQIEKDMKEIFNVRGGASNVAHAIGSTDISQGILEKAENLTRRSLRHFLALEQKYGGRGNVLKALKDEMLKVDFPS